jgi:hypothetical protein
MHLLVFTYIVTKCTVQEAKKKKLEYLFLSHYIFRVLDRLHTSFEVQTPVA